LGMESEELPAVVPGRSCGACSLCCKLLRIDALEKPNGQWCAHCAPGRGGCKIYNNRPEECRLFYCGWLTTAELGDEWRPLACKMVLYAEYDGNRIALHVDPADPGAWRREPYFTQLKQMAIDATVLHQQVIVYIRNKVIVVLPNKEVDLGIFEPGDHAIVAEQNLPYGKDWRAFKKAAKDVAPDQVGKWVHIPAKR
jgi:hypothetical protein